MSKGVAKLLAAIKAASSNVLKMRLICVPLKSSQSKEYKACVAFAFQITAQWQGIS